MNGILFIVSAPSGAGKTSMLKSVIPADDNLVLSVSHTTRAMREGEVDGVDYHFDTNDSFEALIEKGAFLERAHVFGNYYGTSEHGVRAQLESGHDVVLEIDWQGAQQVRNCFTDSVSIFVLPPSIAALRERLSARGQDSEDIVDGRMEQAKQEIEHHIQYDYIIVNDDFELAVSELKSIITACRLRKERTIEKYQSSIKDMLA